MQTTPYSLNFCFCVAIVTCIICTKALLVLFTGAAIAHKPEETLTGGLCSPASVRGLQWKIKNMSFMWNIFWGLCLPPCLVRSTSEAWLLADELDCYRLENSSSLYWWYETFTCVLLFLFVSWFVLDFSVLCIFKGRSSPVVPTLCAPISCGLDIWGRLLVCGLFSKNVSFCGLFSEGVPVDPTLSDQSCGEPLLSLFYFLCSQCFVDRGPKRLLSTDVCLNLSFKPRIIFLKMLVLEGEQGSKQIMPHCC